MPNNGQSFILLSHCKAINHGHQKNKLPTTTTNGNDCWNCNRKEEMVVIMEQPGGVSNRVEWNNSSR